MTRVRIWLGTGSRADRLAVAFGVVLVGLVVIWGRQPTDDGPGHRLDAAAIGLLAIGAGVLLAGRRAPTAVAFAELALSIVWYGRYSSRLIDAPTLVAFYLVGTTGDRVRQLAVSVVATAALVAGALFGGATTSIALIGTGFAVAAVLFGELVNSRRQLLAEYADRAARAEAEREADAERRVAAERLRIARDVHDVLAHTVSVMTVQAGVALDAVDRDPAAARAALDQVRTAGRQAMGEIRATVGVLRGVRPAETSPAPGLDRIAELAGNAEVQGLHVDLSIDVGAEPVVDLVALTTYRIVQESLTNVIRHADASTASVRIARDGSDLVVEVADDGRPVPTPSKASAGYGLHGMRERVEAVGGELHAGPDPTGGWTVRAILPTRVSVG